MWTFALFVAKNFGFFEIYGMSVRTRGEEFKPVRTFFGQGGVKLFEILCGRLLWTTPNLKLNATNYKISHALIDSSFCANI